MLGEKDLIFLGACLILNKDGYSPLNEIEVNRAIEAAKNIYNKTFDDDMICE